MPKLLQFTCFSLGKIWFGGFAPCKRILQLWMDARFSAILTLNISLNPTMCIVHFYLHGKLLMDARFPANDGEFAILIFARMWNWESRSSCFLIFSLWPIMPCLEEYLKIFNRRRSESIKWMTLWKPALRHWLHFWQFNKEWHGAALAILAMLFLNKSVDDIKYIKNLKQGNDSGYCCLINGRPESLSQWPFRID